MGIAGTAHLLWTMARRGMLNPGWPHRIVRQLSTLHRWGPTLAGGYGSAAARDPERVAVADEHGQVTFGELDERSTRRALGWARQGGTGPIGIICRNHRGFVEALVAAEKLGWDTVLVNTSLGAEQIRAVLAGAGVSVVVGDPEFGADLFGADLFGADLFGADLFGDHGVPRAAEPPDEPADPGEPADPVVLTPPAQPGRTIILTSGTTGPPKGARRPAPGGLSGMAAMLSRIPLRVHDTVLIAPPLFHTWGYGGLQLAMAVRATVVLRDRFDAADTLRTLADRDCTGLWAVPIMLQRMLELPADVRRRNRPRRLRVVASSGSALAGDLATRFMDEFGDVLYNIYGSTEASWAAVASPADLRAAPDTAGRPPYGTTIRILDRADPAGAPVPRGAVGHVFVGNELPFEGYLNGSGAPDPTGLVGTGDLGYLDAAGRLYLAGRADSMIVSGGENVYPSQVEDVLAGAPGVAEVCVIGVPDAEFGQRLAAWVVPAAGATVTAEDIRDHVRDRLARYAVPRDVHLVDSLPRTPTGKVPPRLLRPPD